MTTGASLRLFGRPVVSRARLAYLVVSLLVLQVAVAAAIARYPEGLPCERATTVDEYNACIEDDIHNFIAKARLIGGATVIASGLFASAFRRRLDVRHA